MIALLALTLTPHAPAKTEAKKGTVYVVATAHLDTNWLWTIQDTIRDNLPKTMNVNFDYFRTFPDYVFNFEASWHYMLMKEYYPDKFAELKDWVKKGRWNVAGSWVNAVDVNIPSPESLIRQTLYGNGFFKKEFGKTSTDIFLPDCFGFSYALPSIAAYCGLNGFATQKLDWGSSVGKPFAVGMWEGVDGSSIVAALDPGSYGSSVPADLANNSKEIARLDANPEHVDYRFHGTGDTGGGPKRESVENLEKNLHADGTVKVLATSTDQMYKDLTPAQKSNLPRYKGELLLTTHGTGCYTSQAIMKKWNRENEQLADAAERLAVAADWIGGATYPKQKLTDAWMRFLWHQFHDDLTGTSIPQVYPFSWSDEALSLNQFAEVLTNSATAVSAAMDTRAEGIPLVVYNALGCSRSDVVEASIDFGNSLPRYVRVFGPDGQEVPAQEIGMDGTLVRIAFLATVGPVSTTSYDVRGSDEPCRIDAGLSVSTKGLDSNFYHVVLDSDGDVEQIVAHHNIPSFGQPLLKSPIRLEMRDDISPNWPSWEVTWDTVQSKPREIVGGPAEIKVVENGPARVAVEVTRQAGGSTFVQRIQLSANGDRVEFPTQVTWRSKQTLLKANFNLIPSNPNATYDLGLGTIERGDDSEKKYEVPAQQWADVTDKSGDYGVSILNDCKYGWDKPDDNTLRLTLLHTARSPRGNYSFQETNDLGHHEFTYAVMGHTGDWRTDTQREAARLNQPLRAFQTVSHPGALGKSFSLVSCDNPAVKIDAIKKAEISNEVVVRLFEQSGKAQGATLNFAAPVTSIREVDGQENPVATSSLPMSASGSQIKFSMQPYRPRSFAITLGNASVRSNEPASNPVALPYNVNAVSKHGMSAVGGFNPEGHSIPAELFPHSTTAEDVRFDFGPADGLNCVIARGQTIELGQGDYNKVEVLAASVSRDIGRADFTIGSEHQFATVPNYSARLGQWDNRMDGDQVLTDPDKFGRPYMKRVPVGWLATHRHDGGGNNEPYIYVYLFKLTFDVPKGAHTLTLPNDANLRVMAVSTVSTKLPALSPAGYLYR